MTATVTTELSVLKMAKPETPQNGILARRRSVGLNFPVLPSRSGSPLVCHSRSASPVTNPRYRRISAHLPRTAAAETQTSPTRPVPPPLMARKAARPRSRSGRAVFQSLCSSAREQLSRVRRATSRDRGLTKRQRFPEAPSNVSASSDVVHKSTDTSVSGLIEQQDLSEQQGLSEQQDLREKQGLSEHQDLREKGLREKGLSEKGLSEKGLSEKGLSDKGLSDKGLREKGLPTVQLLELREDGSRVISLRRPEGAAFGFFVVQDSQPPHAFRVTRLVSSAVERRYGALFGVGSEILEVETSPSDALTMPDLLTLVSNRTCLRLRVKSAEFLL